MSEQKQSSLRIPVVHNFDTVITVHGNSVTGIT